MKIKEDECNEKRSFFTRTFLDAANLFINNVKSDTRFEEESLSKGSTIPFLF